MEIDNALNNFEILIFYPAHLSDANIDSANMKLKGGDEMESFCDDWFHCFSKIKHAMKLKLKARNLVFEVIEEDEEKYVISIELPPGPEGCGKCVPTMLDIERNQEGLGMVTLNQTLENGRIRRVSIASSDPEDLIKDFVLIFPKPRRIRRY